MDIRFMLNTKISSAQGINGLHLLLSSVMPITAIHHRLVKHSNCHYYQTKHYTHMHPHTHTQTHRLDLRNAFLFHNITTLLNDDGYYKN